MQQISTRNICSLVLVFSGILATGPAFAEKPSWAGGAKSANNQHEEQQAQDHKTAVEPGAGKHFDERQRTIARNYINAQSRAKRCPPGLAKKNNGCMPPGQAKKWAVGQPLPKDVSYYKLPSRIEGQLGVPPAGQRYVRVASDILLIATGTGMVMDAIEDLRRK